MTQVTVETDNPLEILAIHLRDLIKPDRAEFVAWFAARIRRGLERFLESREGSKTIREVYPDGYQPIGLREATDYFQVETDYYNSRRRSPLCVTERPEDRQPWAVSFKDDAEAQILRIAERQADDQIQAFLSRATAKLGPVVERAGSYSVDRVGRTSLNGSVWVGELSFIFDEISFVARLKVITNFSVNGKPYAQYPMTFHAVHLGGPDGCSMVESIESIWAAVGYVSPPEPAPLARRWKKLVSGSIVRIDGKLTLVESPSAARKAGIPEDAEQVARITSAVVHTNPYRGEPCVTGTVEFADDGRTQRCNLMREVAAEALDLDRDGKFNQATAAARKAVFASILLDPMNP